MIEDRTATLVNRLRGVYHIPINDGAGPLNGSMVFAQDRGDQGPIQRRAALIIERLQFGEQLDRNEIDDIINELMEPDFPLGDIDYPKIIIPIRKEAAERINKLWLELSN